MIAIVAASLSLLVGFLVRTNAEDWSRNVVSREGPATITKRFDEGRHLLLRDVGAVLLGFGVVLTATLFVHWVAEADRERRPPAA